MIKNDFLYQTSSSTLTHLCTYTLTLHTNASTHIWTTLYTMQVALFYISIVFLICKNFLVESLGLYNSGILLSEKQFDYFLFPFVYCFVLPFLYWYGQNFTHKVQSDRKKHSFVSCIMEDAFKFSKCRIMLSIQLN